MVCLKKLDVVQGYKIKFSHLRVDKFSTIILCWVYEVKIIGEQWRQMTIFILWWNIISLHLNLTMSRSGDSQIFWFEYMDLIPSLNVVMFSHW